MVVGEVEIQFREKISQEYLFVLTLSMNKGWHNEWFYTTNYEPTVPCNMDARPKVRGCWTDPVPDERMGQVRELVALIKDLKNRGLTSIGVMINYATSRI